MGLLGKINNIDLDGKKAFSGMIDLFPNYAKRLNTF